MLDKTTETLTPMQQRYFRLKETLLPGTLLAIRMGDFYEFFGEDAVTASRALRITLTARGKMKMTGFPYHALLRYVNHLVLAGHRVALVELDGEKERVETHEPKPSS